MNEKQEELIDAFFGNRYNYQESHRFKTTKASFLKGQSNEVTNHQIRLKKIDRFNINFDQKLSGPYFKRISGNHPIGNIRPFLELTDTIKQDISGNIFITYRPLCKEKGDGLPFDPQYQPTFIYGSHEMALTDAPPAVTWIVFYDNDTKAIVYDKSPQFVTRRSQNINGGDTSIKYVSQYAFRVSLNRKNYINFKTIKLNEIRRIDREYIYDFLDYYNINNHSHFMQSSIVSNPTLKFNEALL
jgi:hypothetical protein